MEEVGDKGWLFGANSRQGILSREMGKGFYLNAVNSVDTLYAFVSFLIESPVRGFHDAAGGH